jgi:hypothetical protein
MSCTICNGLRGGEGSGPLRSGEVIVECQRTPECVRAAPGYFTSAERIAAGASLPPREGCTSNECAIRQECVRSGGCGRSRVEGCPSSECELRGCCTGATACLRTAANETTYDQLRRMTDGLAAKREAHAPTIAKIHAARGAASSLPTVQQYRELDRHTITRWVGAPEPTEDRGPHWRQTYTGRQVWPLNPRVGDFAIVDIAYGMAGINRYGGGALRNYNVAEHSVLVSLYGDPAYARHKLLHDAAEAITGLDMGAPIKRHPKLAFWRAIEDANQHVIYVQFGIDPTDLGDTKDIDTRILLDEKAVLMGPSPSPWHVPGAPLGCEIRCLGRDHAAELFLSRFRELFPEYRGP